MDRQTWANCIATADRWKAHPMAQGLASDEHLASRIWLAMQSLCENPAQKDLWDLLSAITNEDDANAICIFSDHMANAKPHWIAF